MPTLESVLHFHSCLGDRVKGILIKFGDYTKLTGLQTLGRLEPEYKMILINYINHILKIWNKVKVIFWERKANYTVSSRRKIT